MGRRPLRQREDSLEQTVLEPTFLNRQIIRLGPSLPGDNFSRGKIRRGNNKFAENMRAEKLHSTIRLLAVLPITASRKLRGESVEELDKLGPASQVLLSSILKINKKEGIE